MTLRGSRSVLRRFGHRPLAGESSWGRRHGFIVTMGGGWEGPTSCGAENPGVGACTTVRDGVHRNRMGWERLVDLAPLRIRLGRGDGA